MDSDRRAALFVLILGVGTLLMIIVFLIHRQTHQPQAYNPPSTPVPVPVPSFTPTPIPYVPPEEPRQNLPSPTPLPKFSIDQINDNVWRLVVPRGQWFETGIPVIANRLVDITSPTDHAKFLVSIEGKTEFSQPDCCSPGHYIGSFSDNPDLYMGAETLWSVTPDFKRIIKIKVFEEQGRPEVIILKIRIGKGRCTLYNPASEHMAIHSEAEEWEYQMRSRITAY